MSDQEGMDRLLRQALSAPMPSVSPGFDRRVMRATRPRRLERTGVLVMTAYAGVAVVVSVWAMRGADIGWGLMAAALLVPLVAAVAGVRSRLVASLAG